MRWGAYVRLIWCAASMIRAMFTPPIAVSLATLLAVLALAQDRQVRIHNNTGAPLYRFQSTNSGAEFWGKDVRGASTLPPGAAVMLDFDNAHGDCAFDFRAVSAGGQDLTRDRVNVCEVSDYAYKY